MKTGWGAARKTAYFSAVSIPYWLVHVAAVAGVAFIGFSWSGLVLALGLYATRMFFITAGYHRYFSHRTYKTSRWFQFLLALGGSTAIQKGVLWWAAHHRDHHRQSDTDADIHSPRHGFWWSHMGWFLGKGYEKTKYDGIRDMARFRELVWLNKMHLLPPIALAVALYLLGGTHALIWGFFVSTSLLWHGTFTINSLSHVWGSRRYPTEDTSRNNWFLALITLGEGWHNNHHHHASSANQGFRWYEIDISYYVLKILALVGVVWDVRKAPAHVVLGQKLTPKLANAKAA